MIHSVQGFFSKINRHLDETVKPVAKALQEAVNKVARSRFILMATYIAVTAVCAYLHDYNFVLIYALGGILFHKQIPELTNPIITIVKAPFLLLNSLTQRPVENFKIFNWRVLIIPNFLIKCGLGFATCLTFVYLSPISVLAAEILCAASCGAALAHAAISIVNHYKDKNSLLSLS